MAREEYKWRREINWYEKKKKKEENMLEKETFTNV